MILSVISTNYLNEGTFITKQIILPEDGTQGVQDLHSGRVKGSWANIGVFKFTKD